MNDFANNSSFSKVQTHINTSNKHGLFCIYVIYPVTVHATPRISWKFWSRTVGKGYMHHPQLL